MSIRGINIGDYVKITETRLVGEWHRNKIGKVVKYNKKEQNVDVLLQNKPFAVGFSISYVTKVDPELNPELFI